MPWRGPSEPGEFPTLGHQILELGESVCVIPDGDRRGQPMLLTDEQARFVLWWYRIDPKTGRFHHPRGGQIVRPQKWGKDPFASWLICIHCHPESPVIFDGWDSSGEPVGRPWSTPWVQVSGVSEDATDNTWLALQPMIELGPLADLWPDTGRTRINLHGGGLIEPVTSSAHSRFGQRINLAIQGETHLWTPLNGMRRVADTQRRNLGGVGGRFLEITNAWDPNTESVAKDTNTEHGVYVDDVEPGAGSVKNRQDRRRMMRRVYGDSWHRPRPESERIVNGWVDLDRIDDEAIALLGRDPLQVERYYLNRKQPGSGAVFDLEAWAKAANPKHEVPAGAAIVIGADGPRFSDSYAVVATEIATGHQWIAGCWNAPKVLEGQEPYEHPGVEIDGAVLELAERFRVVRAYVNPTWSSLLDTWRGRWDPKVWLPWPTNRPRAMAHATRNYVEAVAAGDLSHDGQEDLGRHIEAARRNPVNVLDEQRRPMFTIGHEPNVAVNAAVAGCLSWEARGDAIAAGALTSRPAPATGAVEQEKTEGPGGVFARNGRRDRLTV